MTVPVPHPPVPHPPVPHPPVPHPPEGDRRPALLLYCQHSLGMGHLARSLQLAAALARRFEVVLASGGRRPAGVVVPPGVRVVDLPPLGHDEERRLVGPAGGYDLAAIQARRRGLLLRLLHEHRPEVLLLELYPFGRRRFEFELVPLLEAAEAMPGGRPLVASSVRDLLVAGRVDQAGHDDRAAAAAERWLDVVLVHADPRFARLEDSFAPRRALRVPVHHTGFVAPPARPAPPGPRSRRLLVSAGGGMVGAELVDAAVAVHADLHRRTGLTTTVVLGPLAPDADWRRLQERARSSPWLQAVRRVPDLRAEIEASALSLSQAGYNTCMDLLRARTPALVVPYAAPGEDEQRRRADALARLGLVRTLPADRLTPARLLEELVATAGTEPTEVRLDLTGADRSTALLAELVRRPRATRPAAVHLPAPEVVR